MFPLYVQNDNSNNLIGVFRPLYIYARLHGLFPFRIHLKQKFALNKPFVSKFDSLIFILHLVLYASYTFLNICYNGNENVEIPAVLNIGNRIVLVCGILSGFVVIVIDLLNRKNVWKIFQMFEVFDRMVNYLFRKVRHNIHFKICLQIRLAPITINYNDQRKHLRIYLLAWALVSIALLVYSAAIYLNYIRITQFALLVSSYILSNGISSSVLNIYAFFLYNLQVRYNLLNKNIK